MRRGSTLTATKRGAGAAFPRYRRRVHHRLAARACRLGDRAALRQPARIRSVARVGPTPDSARRFAAAVGRPDRRPPFHRRRPARRSGVGDHRDARQAWPASCLPGLATARGRRPSEVRRLPGLQARAADTRRPGRLGHRPPVRSRRPSRAWLESPERRRLLTGAAAFDADTRIRKVRSGFEFWFAPQDVGAPHPPPTWKQNLFVV